MQSYKNKLIYAIILLTFNKLIIILFRNFRNINIAVPQKVRKSMETKKATDSSRAGDPNLKIYNIMN